VTGAPVSVLDSGGGGIGSDLPPSWSRDCDQKRVRVEVGAYPDESGITEWREIPTRRVETRITKGEHAPIEKNTRVDFPTVWDDTHVRAFVKGFGTSQFTVARISHKNVADVWVPTTVGYVAGVGGTTNELESKMWVYDFTKLFDAVPVNESFTSPTVSDVISRIATNIVKETDVPLTNVVLVAPDAVTEERDRVAALLGSPATAGVIYAGLQFATPTVAQAVSEISSQKIVEGKGGERISTGLGPEDVPGDGLVSAATKFVLDELALGTKKFNEYEDTLLDICTWLKSKTNLQWHFEPTDNGVALVFHMTPPSRRFIGDAVAKRRAAGDFDLPDIVADQVPVSFGEAAYTGFDTIEVLENNALFEIAPTNTATVIGETGSGLLPDPLEINTLGKVFNPFPSAAGVDTTDEAASVSNVDETGAPQGYPVVTARSDALYAAAGETELEVKTVDSEAETVETAKAEAVSTLRDAVTQRNEGAIDCLGNPYIHPFDTLDAFEQCYDIVDATPVPVRYEVNEVTHIQDMGGYYRTHLDVGVHLRDSQISFPTAKVKQPSN